MVEQPGNTLVTRLVAVDHISRCVSPETRGALLRFYGELLALPQGMQDGDADSPGRTLCFRSEQIELRFVFGEPAAPDARGKIVLEVNSLDEVLRRLDEHGIMYEWTHGLSFTDQRIRTRDPAHHVVILQQTWPF